MEVDGFLNIDSLSEKCVNCARDLKNPVNGLSKSPMNSARISAFHYTENARQFRKTVVEGLGEVFKHKWLKLDQDGQDFPMIMCYNCSISFSVLYQAYVDFKGKQNYGSALRVITEVLDAQFGKYETSSLYESIVRKILMPTKRKPDEISNHAVNKRFVPNVPARITVPQKVTPPKVSQVSRVVTSKVPAAATPSQLVTTTDPGGPRIGQIQTNCIISESSPIVGKLLNAKNPAVVPPSDALIKVGDKLFRVVRKEPIPAKKTDGTQSVMPSPSDVRKHVCPLCDKDFPSDFRLECHRSYCGNFTVKVKKPTPCQLCDTMFMSNQELVAHQRAVHLGKGYVMCTFKQCDRVFKTSEARDKHLDEHLESESGMSRLIASNLATAFSEQQQNIQTSLDGENTMNTEGINPEVVNIKEEEMWVWGSSDQGADHFILG